MAVEDPVRGKEPLSLGGRLEALHLALSSSIRSWEFSARLFKFRLVRCWTSGRILGSATL
jgi:hypothetical protein